MSEHKICYDGIKLRKIEKEESEEGSLIRLESKCALLIESLRVCKPLVEYIHFPTDILARKLEALVESLNSIDTIISKYITCIDELYETDFKNELYETDLSDEEIKYATEIVISVNKPNIWHLINWYENLLHQVFSWLEYIQKATDRVDFENRFDEFGNEITRFVCFAICKTIPLVTNSEKLIYLSKKLQCETRILAKTLIKVHKLLCKMFP